MSTAKTDKKILTDAQRHQLVRVKLDLSKDDLAKALSGSSMDLEKFTRVALTAWERGDENLMAAHPASIASAVMAAAQLGLSLDPLIGEAYLVARKNSKHDCMWAGLMIGYKGLLKRGRKSSSVEMFDAGVVYEGDELIVRQGTEPMLEHTRSLSVTKEPQVVAAWAVAHFKGGFKRIVVVPRWELDKARKQGAKYGPWVQHFGAMSQKTALRRLLAVCPMDEDTQSALGQEEANERGEFIDPRDFETGETQVVAGAPSNAAPVSVASIKAGIAGGKVAG